MPRREAARTDNPLGQGFDVRMAVRDPGFAFVKFWFWGCMGCYRVLQGARSFRFSCLVGFGGSRFVNIGLSGFSWNFAMLSGAFGL